MKAFFVVSLFLLSQYSQALVVGFLSDLEGSKQRLIAYYEANPEVFKLGSDGQYHIRDNAIFVYGGDAMDRFYGNLFVMRELNRHFVESPSGFVSIAGNRDINKFRPYVELNPKALEQVPLQVNVKTDEEIASYEAAARILGDRAQRLQFMFGNRKNMGAADKFENLRLELTDEGYKGGRLLTDTDVADFYYDYLSPGGLGFQVISRMKLAYRIGNTLFVHGGVTEESMGRVPDRPDVIFDDLDEWVRELNRFYSEMVAVITKEGANWAGPSEPRVGDLLLNYPMPREWEIKGSRMDSVVTGKNTDEFINPVDFSPLVQAWLKRNGIDRVMMGHNPIGQYPILVRERSDSVEQGYGDNSHSAENYAYSFLLLGRNLQHTLIRGRVTIGEQDLDVQTSLTLGKPSLVGRSFSDGRRVLGRVQTPDGVAGDYVSTLLEYINYQNHTHQAGGLECALNLKRTSR